MFEKVDEEIFDGDERLQIINEMRAFAEKSKTFDLSYLNGVEDSLEKKVKE